MSTAQRPGTVPRVAPGEARDAKALRLFRQLVGAIRAHYGHVERTTGAAAAEIQLLDAIVRHDGASIGRIADALSLHKSTVSNLVGQLVDKGLATRNHAPDNQRSVVVRATVSGRALIRRAPRPASGLLQGLLAKLTPEELVRVEDSLELLVGKLPPETRAYGGESLAVATRRERLANGAITRRKQSKTRG